jgi:hypothetical protein
VVWTAVAVALFVTVFLVANQGLFTFVDRHFVGMTPPRPRDLALLSPHRSGDAAFLRISPIVDLWREQ